MAKTDEEIIEDMAPERDALRAELAKVTAERDEAQLWQDRFAKQCADAANAIDRWMLVPPDGGDLTLVEGVNVLLTELAKAKARIAELESGLRLGVPIHRLLPLREAQP